MLMIFCSVEVSQTNTILGGWVIVEDFGDQRAQVKTFFQISLPCVLMYVELVKGS